MKKSKEFTAGETEALKTLGLTSNDFRGEPEDDATDATKKKWLKKHLKKLSVARREKLVAAHSDHGGSAGDASSKIEKIQKAFQLLKKKFNPPVADTKPILRERARDYLQSAFSDFISTLDYKDYTSSHNWAKFKAYTKKEVFADAQFKDIASDQSEMLKKYNFGSNLLKWLVRKAFVDNNEEAHVEVKNYLTKDNYSDYVINKLVETIPGIDPATRSILFPYLKYVGVGANYSRLFSLDQNNCIIFPLIDQGLVDAEKLAEFKNRLTFNGQSFTFEITKAILMQGCRWDTRINRLVLFIDLMKTPYFTELVEELDKLSRHTDDGLKFYFTPMVEAIADHLSEYDHEAKAVDPAALKLAIDQCRLMLKLGPIKEYVRKAFNLNDKVSQQKLDELLKEHGSKPEFIAALNKHLDQASFETTSLQQYLLFNGANTDITLYFKLYQSERTLFPLVDQGIVTIEELDAFTSHLKCGAQSLTQIIAEAILSQTCPWPERIHQLKLLKSLTESAYFVKLVADVDAITDFSTRQSYFNPIRDEITTHLQTYSASQPKLDLDTLQDTIEQCRLDVTLTYLKELLDNAFSYSYLNGLRACHLKLDQLIKSLGDNAKFMQAFLDLIRDQTDDADLISYLEQNGANTTFSTYFGLSDRDRDLFPLIDQGLFAADKIDDYKQLLSYGHKSAILELAKTILGQTAPWQQRIQQLQFLKTFIESDYFASLDSDLNAFSEYSDERQTYVDAIKTCITTYLTQCIDTNATLDLDALIDNINQSQLEIVLTNLSDTVIRAFYYNWSDEQNALANLIQTHGNNAEFMTALLAAIENSGSDTTASSLRTYLEFNGANTHLSTYFKLSQSEKDLFPLVDQGIVAYSDFKTFADLLTCNGDSITLKIAEAILSQERSWTQRIHQLTLLKSFTESATFANLTTNLATMSEYSSQRQAYVDPISMCMITHFTEITKTIDVEDGQNYEPDTLQQEIEQCWLDATINRLPHIIKEAFYWNSTTSQSELDELVITYGDNAKFMQALTTQLKTTKQDGKDILCAYCQFQGSNSHLSTYFGLDQNLRKFFPLIDQGIYTTTDFHNLKYVSESKRKLEVSTLNSVLTDTAPWPDKIDHLRELKQFFDTDYFAKLTDYQTTGKFELYMLHKILTNTQTTSSTCIDQLYLFKTLATSGFFTKLQQRLFPALQHDRSEKNHFIQAMLGGLDQCKGSNDITPLEQAISNYEQQRHVRKAFSHGPSARTSQLKLMASVKKPGDNKATTNELTDAIAEVTNTDKAQLKSYFAYRNKQVNLQALFQLPSDKVELFPIVDHNIYSPTELNEMASNNHWYDQDQTTFMQDILQQNLVWPRRINQVKLYKEFTQSGYYQFLETCLFKRLERTDFNGQRLDLTDIHQDIRQIIQDQILISEQNIDLVTLHTKLLNSMKDFANTPEVRSYKSVLSYVWATIGLLVAGATIFLPLLSDGYKATFFRSHNQNQVNNVLYDLKEKEEVLQKEEALPTPQPRGITAGG